MTNLNEWDQATEAAGTVTTAELDKWANQLKAAEEAYEDAKKVSGELYRKMEEIEGKFVEAMQLAGKQKYYIEGVGTYSFTSRLSVPTPKTNEDKMMLARYLEEKGGKALFWSTFGVNSQTLQSFYKNEFAEFEKKCEDEGITGQFTVPGLQAPTAVRGLKLTKDKK